MGLTGALAGLLISGVAGTSFASHSEVVDKLGVGETERVSLSTSGEEGNDDSGWALFGGIGLPCILGLSASDDGRYIAFASEAGNLHPADGNGRLIQDIFVHDRKKDRVELVSAMPSGLSPEVPSGVDPSGGLCSIARSHTPRISGNGRYVAFVSNLPLTGMEDPEATLLRDNIYIRDLKTDSTELVSHTFDGGPPLGGTFGSGDAGLSISDDGRIVAFSSDSTNIVDGACDAQVAVTCGQVYVRYLDQNRTELVSVADNGDPGNSGSNHPALSGNGRAVAFTSEASNLVAGDLNIYSDVFVRDLGADKTELVSVSRNGTSGSDASKINFQGGTALSDNGRFVSFHSMATDLVPAYPPTNLRPTTYCDTHSYVRDMKSGRVERVSVSSTGTILHGLDQDISDDGRFVHFRGRNQIDHVAGVDACSGRADLDGSHSFAGELIQDRATGQVDLVGYRGGNIYEDPPHGSDFEVSSLGGNGRFVIGITMPEDDDVVENDNNDASDVVVRDFYVRERGSGNIGIGERNTVKVLGGSSLAGGGALLKDDPSDSTVPGLGGEILQASLVHRPMLDDLFIRIELDRLAGFGPGTLLPTPTLYGIRFEIGQRVYELRAQALGGPLMQGGARIGLFGCSYTCHELGRVDGGYGTVGENIVASVPLHEIGLTQGGRIEGAHAFAALGSYELGGTRILDSTR